MFYAGVVESGVWGLALDIQQCGQIPLGQLIGDPIDEALHLLYLLRVAGAAKQLAQVVADATRAQYQYAVSAQGFYRLAQTVVIAGALAAIDRDQHQRDIRRGIETAQRRPEAVIPAKLLI